MPAMPDEVLRLGVAGLGRAFMLMLPTFAHHPKVKLVAAATTRPEAAARFAEDFSARIHSSVEALCRDDAVEAIYIATPHELHRAHTEIAAAAGKHVMVEKPMALTLSDCRAMVEAARAAKIHLLVGHSHSFDAPYLRTRELIRSGRFGRVRMINALNFTDYLYRPRRPEELDTSQGGGAIFSQAPHQVDIVRLLAQSEVTGVRASAGIWDSGRPTEGAYQAFLTFADGASASLTYSGYGHFDTDAFSGWIGELGQKRDPARYGDARRALKAFATPEAEAAFKTTRAYGSAEAPPGRDPAGHNHFGLVLVSCDHADLRPLPTEIMIYGDDARWSEPLPPVTIPRAEVIDELWRAVKRNEPPLHSGAWGLATMETCLALHRSAVENREIPLPLADNSGTVSA
jgi:phthalate 4,5-cis-dihydrodiol dehydrogenase